MPRTTINIAVSNKCLYIAFTGGGEMSKIKHAQYFPAMTVASQPVLADCDTVIFTRIV